MATGIMEWLDGSDGPQWSVQATACALMARLLHCLKFPSDCTLAEEAFWDGSGAIYKGDAPGHRISLDGVEELTADELLALYDLDEPQGGGH